MISTDSISVTTVVSVDPAAAFQIFTDEIDLWWKRGPRYRPGAGRNGRMRFEPGAGGRLVEIYDGGDKHVFEIGRIVVWEPGARLVFNWRANEFDPNEVTVVDVRFEPAPDGGTRVTLEHRGWDSIPPEHAFRHGLTGSAFLSRIGLLWGDLLVALREHAQGGRQ